MRCDTYTLEDLASIKYGKNQKKILSKNGGIPIYGTGGIMGYGKEALYNKPSVLIGRKGSIEKIRYVDHPFWTVDTLFYTEINTNLVIPHFLYYKIMLLDLKKYNEGTTVPSLRTETLNKLKFDIPKLEQQKKILSVLEPIDKKIKSLNKINDNLEQQAQAIFKAWFVDFEPFGGVMPDDWKIGNLEDVIKFYNGYAFKSKELLNKQKKSCYAVFKQGHIKSGGGFIPTGTKSWFPKKKSENLQKYILCKGDILMAMTDMKDNVAILGNTAVMAVDNQYLLNQRVGLLRCNGKYEISYPYIYLLTNSKDFLQDLRSRANSGVQVNLSSAAIKESSIIIPSRSTNIKFNQIVKPMFEITFKNNMEIDRLSSLRDTLLPKLMSGEIDVSNIEI